MKEIKTITHFNWTHHWDRNNRPTGCTVVLNIPKETMDLLYKNPLSFAKTGVPVNIGFSICHPKDQYNKKVGLKLAKENAVGSQVILKLNNIVILDGPSLGFSLNKGRLHGSVSILLGEKGPRVRVDARVMRLSWLRPQKYDAQEPDIETMLD